MKKSVFYVLLVSFLFLISFSKAEDPSKIGSDLTGDLKNYYMGDKNTLNDKLFAPGTDASKPLVTIEGEEGKGSFNCMKDTVFAEIEYHPVAGNDINLLIKEDLDGNGEFEYSKTISGVSGICLTGVIKCNSGTSNNCSFVRFGVTPSGYIDFLPEETYSPKVDVCYFINASGGNISVNFPNGVGKILSDVGGLVSNLSAPVLKFTGVTSEKDYANFKIRLSGTNPSSCVDSKVSTIDKAESYYHKGEDDSALLADVDNLKAGLKGDSPIDGSGETAYQGIYEYARTSPGIENGASPSITSCYIRKEIVAKTESKNESCSDVIYMSPYEYCVSYYRTNCPSKFGCRYFNYPVYDRDTGEKTFSGSTSFTVHPKQKAIIFLEQIRSGGDRNVYFDRTINLSGDYTKNISKRDEDSQWYNVPKTHTVFIPEDNHKDRTINLDWHMSFYGEGSNHSYPGKYYYAMVLLSREYFEDSVYLTKSDTCSSISKDCTLRKKWVCLEDGNNCIKVFDSVNPIVEPKITPYCFNKATQLNNYSICADGTQITAQRLDENGEVGETKILDAGDESWFYVKKEYLCPNEGNPDMPGDDFFKDAVKTRESIYTDKEKTDYNFDKATGSFSYRDYGNGGVSRTSRITTIKDSCEMVCRVKVAAEEKGDPNDEEYAAYNPEPNSPESIVKVKPKMDYMKLKNCVDNRCPLEPGETLVDDCFCIGDEKNIDLESLADIQTVYEMSKDMICSSSPP